jgi:YccS/YhfK family integral membrane protein
VDYIKEYKKFINSYNVNDAVRITIGICLPAMVLGYFNLLPIGLLVSLGAMAVSNGDIPGPMHRRLLAMVVTLFLISLIAILVGLFNSSTILLGVLIAVLCFALSIIGIYGTRVNAIGFAGLIIMVLSMEKHQSLHDVLMGALFLAAGGAWYILLSLALFHLRPYKIIQQALGESIFFIGDYLKVRSNFYDPHVDYDKTYRNLMAEQQKVHDRQELLREMIFKSRSLTRQSATNSRGLLIIFLETIDLFEKTSGTLYDYKQMHELFDNTGILPKFKNGLLTMADELHTIGLSVQSGHASTPSSTINEELNALKKNYEAFKKENSRPDNLESRLMMGRIMQSIEDLAVRIYALHNYTKYDRKKIKNYQTAGSYDSFVAPTNLSLELLKENLTLSSNTLRHALRVSAACVAGYIIAHLLHLGYSYWVLLTILVILKPSYSLSRQRNVQRITGTIIGALLGVGLLAIVHTQVVFLFIIVVFMLATYSFIRTQYLLGVVFLTAYVLIFFYMLNKTNFQTVITDRVIDTALGSLIAFIIIYLVVPSWEKEKVRSTMAKALEKSSLYFQTVAASFEQGCLPDLKYRMKRKDAFVAQANLSGGLTRMLNEPKNKQQSTRWLHQFVVLIYTLNSHIVALADYAQKFSAKYKTDEFKAIIDDIAEELAKSKNLLLEKEIQATKNSISSVELKEEMEDLIILRLHEMQQGLVNTETKTALTEYKPIVDQFLFISRIAEDIKRVVKKMI